MVSRRIGKPFALHRIDQALHTRVIPDRFLKVYTQSLCADEVQKYVPKDRNDSDTSCGNWAEEQTQQAAIMNNVTQMAVTTEGNVTGSVENATNVDMTTILLNEQFFYDLATDYRYIIAAKMNDYLPIVACGIGLPGNALSLVVILRMRPFTTSSLFLSCLSVCDFLYLVAFCLVRFLYKVSHGAYSAMCVGGEFMTWALSYTSLCIVAGLAVERGLAVWLPFKVGSIMTKKRCAIGMGIAAFVSMAINAHNLFTFEMVYVGPSVGYHCRYRQEMIDYSIRVWWKINIFLSSIIPTALFVICNVVIIIGLKRSRALQEQMKSDDDQMRHSAKQSRQVSVMLSTVLGVFVITVFPYGILFATVYVSPEEQGTDKHLWMILFSTLFHSFKDMNHALNCFCYFFTASRFRTGCFDLLTCGKRQKIKAMFKSQLKSAVTTTSSLDKTHSVSNPSA